jgi:chromosome segregation ATPase
MYDDDKGASSGLGGLAWYQIGRWSAEGARRDQELAQARRNQREGRRPVVVDQSYIDALAANRDDLYRDAHHYHHELQLANQEIAKANSHIRQLSGDIENQNRTNTRIRESAARENTRRMQTISYYAGLDHCLGALLKAAEDGKAKSPDYQELKAIIQQMRDAWFHSDALIDTPDRLGPRIVALMRALEQ